MMHKESELSQWFNFSEQKPWEPGVYGVKSSALFFSWWDGKNFHGGWATPERAIKFREHDGNSYYKNWRGLSYDPSLPKKLARRTDPATSKEAAAKVVKSGALKSHCAKIRACLVEHGRMTPSEIASKLKMRRSSVFRRMSDLKRDGFASRTGEKRGGQSVWNAI